MKITTQVSVRRMQRIINKLSVNDFNILVNAAIVSIKNETDNITSLVEMLEDKYLHRKEEWEQPIKPEVLYKAFELEKITVEDL